MISKIAVIFGCIALVNSALIPVGYNFGYDITGETDSHSRQESRDANGDVTGSYMIKDADGRQRRVTYTAGSKGFHANIESNEPGVLSKSSANAKVNGAELPVAHPTAFEESPLQTEERLVPVAYKFGYDIQGSADSQSREESGEHGKVVGSYSLKDTDGRSRKVNYEADENGFRATINTNEHGTAAKSPADVNLISPYPAPVPVEPLTPSELPSAPVSFHSFSSSSSSSGYGKTIEHKAPVESTYVAPLEHFPAAPVEYSQKTVQAPLAPLAAPGPVYTSRTHSSTTYAKAPAQEHFISQAPADPLPIKAPADPLPIKAPLEFVQPAQSSYTSRTHSSTTYTKSTPQFVQEEYKAPAQVLEAAPLPLKSAPVQQEVFTTSAPAYKSYSHSSIQFAPKELPATQEKFFKSYEAPKFGQRKL